MKKIIYIITSISLLLLSCEEDERPGDNLNYVSFETTSYDFGVDINGSNSNDIKVYTTNILGIDRVFNIVINESISTADPIAYSVPTSVTVPANSNVGAFTVSISDTNISSGGETLMLEFSDETGLFIGTPISLNISQICPLPETILNITFDGFPEEQAWKILDANDTVLFEGGPYPDQTDFIRAFCLSQGSYKIRMTDSYGDGGGAYTLSNNGVTLVSSDGTYGFGEEISFQVN